MCTEYSGPHVCALPILPMPSRPEITGVQTPTSVDLGLPLVGYWGKWREPGEGM